MVSLGLAVISFYAESLPFKVFGSNGADCYFGLVGLNGL